MEMPNKAGRGTRKENIPPLLSGNATPEHGRVQKNVNINLFLGSFREAAVPASGCSRAAAHGKSPVASLRGADPQRRVLVQTNLSGPYLPGGVSGGSSRQQSNLENKLGGCRSDTVACVGYPSCRRTADLGPSCSRWERVDWKSSPQSDFSERGQRGSQKPRFGLCDVPCSYTDSSRAGIGIQDPHLLNRSRGCFWLSGGSCQTLGTAGGPACPLPSQESPPAGSFLHDWRRHPESPSRRCSSPPPGPALSLEHLRASPSLKGHAAPRATLQTLLSSSQVSAALHSSLRRLQEEGASMGALGSFPWEAKPLPPPHPFTSGRPVAAEWRAREESCAKHASTKWQKPLARDWGLASSTGAWEEPHPLGYYRCRNTELYVHSVEASDQDWPSSSCGGGGSCKPSLGAEGLCSRFFQPPESGRGDAPLCCPSFGGLEVSLEALRDSPLVTAGVTMDGTQRELYGMVGQLGHFSKNELLHRFREELAGAEGVLPALLTMDEAALWPPAGHSLEEEAAQRLGGPPLVATDGPRPTGFGTKHASFKDCWADARPGRGGEPPPEKHAESSRFLPCEKSRYGTGAVQKGTLGRNDRAMGRERSRAPPVSTLLLAQCFAAWRNHVFAKRAAARALYERQLLRKGVGALKWALELRQVQEGLALRRHSQWVLAASFRRWQEATARRQQERASRAEMEVYRFGSLAAPGVGTIALHPLPAECLEAATHYGRAEGNLWLQIRRDRGVDKPDRRAQAVRDMRRLAAFRIWCLQKERLEEEESRAREACVFLQKRRLRNAFQTWQSHHRAAAQILPLRAQIHRRLLSRCFNTWRGFAEREARGRQSRDRRQTGALRLCFRHWAQMVEVQERTRKKLLELLALRRKTAPARFGFALDKPTTQLHPDVVRRPQRDGADSLDSLCFALALQGAFYTWRARWQQQQRLNAFRQAADETLLRKTLGRWCWKAFRSPPLGRCSGDPAEESPLASLDSDEFSTSSGFHSNAPALPASGDQLEREGNLMGSISASVSSLVTITDPGPLLQPLSPSPTPSLGWEDLGRSAVDCRVQASSPLSREDGFVSDAFQAVEFLHPEDDVPSMPASPSGDVASSGGEEEEMVENQQQLLARCFKLWSSRTWQNWKGQGLRKTSLLSWAFRSWSAAARSSERHKARVGLETSRRRRLLASCFERWKAGASRAPEQRGEEGLRKRPAGGKARWRWRKAVRGGQALRPGPGTVVQQSSSYWTKAAAFCLGLRERNSLPRAPKLMKVPLSWPSKHRKNRAEGLKGSAFHAQRAACSSQSRRAGPSGQEPPDSPGGAEQKAKHAESRRSGAEVASTRWLWGKYLRLWRHNVLMRRFREACRMRQLESAWLLWKEACWAEWMMQALVRQRLAQGGWKVWRRRYLQTQVAEHFLVAQDRGLLKRAFGRWRHLAAKESDRH
ncbi:uncharacterized protein C1orf167 homolog isoform X2 [Paroedura picta]|uniref:uncharacterized protein C1orf167 homolog isoform X2 n=1 Tax=Paroedura picta TaxID=143630 RepID=UPI0040560AD2